MTVVQSVPRPISRRSVLAGAAAAGLLAGCGTGGAADPGSGGNGFPRTVEHASGRTEIPALPRRVVSTLDYDDLDAVLATGIAPVAFGFSPWLVPGLTPWAGGASGSTRIDGPVATLNLERIAAERPDLVVAESHLVGADLEKLQAVAPTITVGARNGQWQDGTTTVGRATAREAQAADAVARAEAELERAHGTLAGMRGARVAVINRYAGGTRVDSVDDGVAGGGVLLRALGVTPVDGGADPKTRTLSDDEVSRFADVDAILVQDFGMQTDDLLRMPLFARLPAVRERRVARLSPAATRASYLLSSLSVPYAAREWTAALLAARAGRGSTTPTVGAR